jgi:hypothetical protein
MIVSNRKQNPTLHAIHVKPSRNKKEIKRNVKYLFAHCGFDVVEAIEHKRETVFSIQS